MRSARGLKQNQLNSILLLRGVWYVALALLGVDQIIKYFFHEGSYFNTDFFFFSDVSRGVMVVCSAVILAVLVGIAVQTKSRFIPIIIAGGFSNALDRLLWGGVVDPWYMGSLYFNLADMLIWVGVLGEMKEIWYNKFVFETKRKQHPKEDAA